MVAHPNGKHTRINCVMFVALHTIGLISVSGLFGSMAFFSAVVAPYTFTQLDAATAGRFVRGIFPWYYLMIATLAAVAGIALLTVRPLEAAVMGAVALTALLSRQVLMPRINDNRDRMLTGDAGAERRFARLHRASVWINSGQLMAALAVLVAFALS